MRAWAGGTPAHAVVLVGRGPAAGEAAAVLIGARHVFAKLGYPDRVGSPPWYLDLIE